MHATKSRSRLMRYLAVIGFGFTLVMILALALLGGSIFSGAFFPLISLWADCLLFYAALRVIARAGVNLTSFHWKVLAVVFAVGLIHAWLQLSSRTFIYSWDYSNYLLLQYEAEEAFRAGAGNGFAQILSSLSADYTSFITFFIEFPFCLTDHTGDSFVFCQMISIFPTIAVLLAGLTVKLGQILHVQNERAYFIIGMAVSVTFPFLRMAAFLGQPDWFGLIFAFMILLLTLDYHFDAPEPGRWVGVFLATAALVLTRRWYLYFIVGYFFSYALLTVLGSVRLAKNGDKTAAITRVKWLAVFGVGSVVAMTLLLWPVVRHILASSYGTSYAAYNMGGLGLELYSQFFRLGLFNLFLMVWGFIYSHKRGESFPVILALLQVMVSILLFTRIQNMGSHQTLLLLPGYYIMVLAGCAALADSLARRRALKIGLCAVMVVLGLTSRLSPLTTVALPDVVLDNIDIEFTRLDKMTYDRTDADAIRALAAWIDENCDEGELAYMIPHSMNYNPDIFKNVDLPARPIDDKLSFGFGILGTHTFPTDYFDAKYVITADPFPWCYEVSTVAEQLNNLFLAERDEYFTYETSFDMGNGTIFSVWRRTVPATRAEAEYFLDGFAAEDAKFPELYSEVIYAWCNAKGLD